MVARPRSRKGLAICWSVGLNLVVISVGLSLTGCPDEELAPGADAVADVPADAGLPDTTAADTGPQDVMTLPACKTSADCEKPDNPCQYASCLPGLGCATLAYPNGAVCKHNDFCQVGGTCTDALCSGAKKRACEDDDPCTVDGCEGGKCVHPGLPAGKALPCDDGNVCTAGDVCEGAKCTSGVDTCACDSSADCADIGKGDKCVGTYYCDKSTSAWKCVQNPASIVTCSNAKDTACTKNTCDPSSGACKMTPQKDGIPCDDGSQCTIGDVCKAGSCEEGEILCCTKTSDCTKKDDGNLCNGVYFCNKAIGQCVFNPASTVTCPSVGNTACTENACNPKTGNCEQLPTNEKKPCDDGNPCTPDSLCKSGKCDPGKNLCPCDKDTDCDGKDDGNYCNGLSYCHQATKGCRPNPTTVVACGSAADTACQKSACDPKSGDCSLKPVPSGTKCYDGNLCTFGDACEKGECKPGSGKCTCDKDADCAQWEDDDLCNGTLYCDLAAQSCKINPKTVVGCKASDNTQCKRSLCQPQTGLCSLSFVNVGKSCDDGVACTVGDVCDAGKCKSGTDVCKCKADGECLSQDDGDLCNGTPYCNKTKIPWVCTTNPKTVISCVTVDDSFCGKTECLPKSGVCTKLHLHTDEPCQDGNPCTQSTVCKLGTCTVSQGDPKNPCDDGNPCTHDNCDPKAGCQFLVNTAPCDDGDACTKGDVCANKSCKSGKPIDCADGNSCTTEICNAKAGCITINNASLCQDGNGCTLIDVCKGGACGAGKLKVCDDGKPCSKDTCNSKTGDCVFDGSIAGHVICDDGIKCTSDSCDPAKGGCLHAPSSAQCSDGVACTLDTCSIYLGCVFQPKSGACDDKKPCTVDLCIAGKGCVHSPDKNGASCSDGKPCTVGDACKSGVCAPGPLVAGCQVDPTQCKGKADGAACSDGDACTKGESCLSGYCRAPTARYVVTSVLGDGVNGNYDEDGYLTQAHVRQAESVAVAPDGSTFFAGRSYSLIRRLDLNGYTTRYGGVLNEPGGFRDGHRLHAKFNQPYGLAFDGKGRLFVGDSNNFRVRVIDTDGMVTTLAGNGANKPKDGKGASAQFGSPRGLAFDDKGVLFVADWSAHSVRRVAADGTVITVAGGAFAGTIDGKGTAARLHRPTGIAWSPRGHFIIADTFSNALRTMTSDGVVKTLARHSSGKSGFVDGKGSTAMLAGPLHVAVDAFGVAWMTESGSHAVRRVMPDGTVTTVVGGLTKGFVNGVGKAARLQAPRGLALHPAGKLIVAEPYRIRSVHLQRHSCDDGSLCTVDTCDAGTGQCGKVTNWCTAGADACVVPTCDAKTGVCKVVDAKDGSPCDDGDICTTAQTCFAGFCTAPAKVTTFAGKAGTQKLATSGRSDGPPADARFNQLGAMAAHPGGGFLVVDRYNNAIRHVADDGWVHTVAGNPGGGGWVDGKGTLAKFNLPTGVAIDAKGGAWITDTGNHRIRHMTPAGEVTTVAGSTEGWVDGTGPSARFDSPHGIAIDAAGAAVVTDNKRSKIRRVTIDGKVSTILGTTNGWVDGPAATARISRPKGVRIDTQGRIWFADSGNSAVRRLNTDGTVETIVGHRFGTRDGDGPFSADFFYLSDIELGEGGLLYIATDYPTSPRVRVRYPDGRVRTLAGLIEGTSNGLGKAAQFSAPISLMRYKGHLLVSDRYGNAIRHLQLPHKNCDDGKACTVDRCDAQQGCISEPVPDGISCDDGEACTAQGACKSGVCAPGKLIGGCVCKKGPIGGCDDGNPCTKDGCHPLKGCSHLPALEGRTCDDGSKCTSGEVCDAGQCTTINGPHSSWTWMGHNGQWGDGWRQPTSGSRASGVVHGVCGTDVDATGTLWVADCYRHTIRKMLPTGTLSTVAGPNLAKHYWGFVNAPGTAARFKTPSDVAAGIDGSIYVADQSNHAIRKIDSKGVVTTLAGNGSPGFADSKGGKAQFNTPTAVTTDASNNVYVADLYNQRLRRIAPDGQVTTLAGDNVGKGRIVDGVGAKARFGGLYDIDMGPDGYIYVADISPSAIRRVSLTGVVETLVYNATQGTHDGHGLYGGNFHRIYRIAVAKNGAVYFADSGKYGREVRRMSPGRILSTIAGGASKVGIDGLGAKAGFGAPIGVNVRPDGSLFVISNSGPRVHVVDTGICNDHNRCTLDKCDPKTGCSHKPVDAKTVCQDQGPCMPATCDPKVGRCSYKARDDGEVCGTDCNQVCNQGFCTAAPVVSNWLGIPSKHFKVGHRSEAGVSHVRGIAEDSKGNIYFADSTSHVIGKVDKSDQVSLFVGKRGVAGYTEGLGGQVRFHTPGSLVMTPNDVLMVSDHFNHRIRRVTLSGAVDTFAGSSAGYKDAFGTLAKFNRPAGLALRSDGVLAVADQLNHRVRLVSAKGAVSTIAGVAVGGSQDGPTNTAQLYNPTAVQWGPKDELYVLDISSGRLRRVKDKMMTTVAGWGAQSFVGHGAMVSGLAGALALARLPSGDMLFGSNKNLIRLIKPNGSILPWVGSKAGMTGGLGPNAQIYAPAAFLQRKIGDILMGGYGNIVRIRTGIKSCSALRGISQKQPAQSCQQINKSKAYDGVPGVWIDTDGKGDLPAFKTQCDLQAEGGGWTLVTADQSVEVVNRLLRGPELKGKGQVMFKCSPTGKAFVMSPPTTQVWAWVAKKAVTGDWSVNKGSGATTKVSCGSDASFSKLKCGFGFGCAAGSTAKDAFMIPGSIGPSACSDTTGAYTGGPMTICGKPGHKPWAVFVRRAP
ncbi:MAG: SMP-30/gluconolactonase/LRE family protein [Myxococcales bacterium]|nr:SMP-30/gluconolactonase/LRE family protein [Myxococcales bacterium]